MEQKVSRRRRAAAHVPRMRRPAASSVSRMNRGYIMATGKGSGENKRPNSSRNRSGGQSDEQHVGQIEAGGQVCLLQLLCWPVKLETVSP